MSASVVIVGAGTGERLGAGTRKAWVEVAGRPLWWHASRPFAAVPAIGERVLVLHEDDLARVETGPGAALLASAGIARAVAGGLRRQDSVRAGVLATDQGSRDVLVHDAARPFVRPERIVALLEALRDARAALLAHPATATVKVVGSSGHVEGTLDRRRLWLAATPQGGRRDLLLELLERAGLEGREVTDEAGLFEAAGVPSKVVEDAPDNLKVTTPADLEVARRRLGEDLPRVGHGYDIHRLVAGRPLVLGGVRIPAEVGLLGHSDGDCLLHAVMEALLGAAGLADIGEHFPDDDPRYAGADSTVLLRAVLEELHGRGLVPIQVDCSVLAERPRLGPWKAAIKERLGSLLGLPADRVAVKARTGEGLDAIGRGEALAVHCTAVVVTAPPRF